MTRSSRHESSYRGQKHSSREARERSDSGEEGSTKEKRSREEEAAAGGSGTKASKGLEYERKGSSSLLAAPGKEVPGNGDGEYSGDHGMKRKERPDEAGASVERCNGSDSQDKVEGEDLDRKVKEKVLAVDLKGRSSRRREVSGLKENTSGKNDSAKRRLEKEPSRRESSVHHKDMKDRERERISETDRERGLETDWERGLDRDGDSGFRKGRENWLEKERERGSEMERKYQDARLKRSSNGSSRKHGGGAGSFLYEEFTVKADTENAELHPKGEMHDTEVEKELEKQTKKQIDVFHDKDKWQEEIHYGENILCIPVKNDKWHGDGGDAEDSWLSSREICSKNVGYNIEYHWDGDHWDKYQDGVNKVQVHQNDKTCDERSSDHASDKSSSKHRRDEKGLSENHYERGKHRDSDHDCSPCTDDHGTKSKENRRRKRFSDENEDHIDVKSRNSKELCMNLERSTAYNCNLDSCDRDRQENVILEKVDYSSSRPKCSPNSSGPCSRDQHRRTSKQMEAMSGNSVSEERISEHRSLEKNKHRVDRRIDELSIKTIPSKYESPRSDVPGSPIQLTEKSPSSTSDRRRTNSADVRRRLNVEEMGQRSSISRDGANSVISEDKEHEQHKEKPISHDYSQADLANSCPIPSGFSFKADNISSGFPIHFLPPARSGSDNSVLGPFDEDNRVLLGDRMSASRHKRSIEFNMNRGQGNAWRCLQTWPSPIANGFLPFQHLPRSGGFHPVIQQFPPPLFGIRPSMDMGHSGISYPMHEGPDRFPNHSRPFGWRNPADNPCLPHFHGWDGNNGLPLDESHVYRRPDWEQSRQLLNNHGWEMGIDVRKGQSGKNNSEIPESQKEDSIHIPSDETWPWSTAHQPLTEIENCLAESNEIKQSRETTSVKDAGEVSPKISHGRTPEPSRMLKDDSAHLCCIYLSKVDISADLARPELYKQCTSLIETVDNVRSNSNISKNYLQGIRRYASVVMKGSNLLGSQFPEVPDAVFQKAMALYKKRNEEMKRNAPQALLKAKEEDSSTVHKVVVVQNLASVEVSHHVDDPLGTADKHVERPADATSIVVFAEDPQACEVLMPECRLNSSRIHHSPESTR